MAGGACLLELLAEPLYILSQNLLLLRLRLIVEAAATLSRCLTMYILIVNQNDMVKVEIGLCCQFWYLYVVNLLCHTHQILI